MKSRAFDARSHEYRSGFAACTAAAWRSDFDGRQPMWGQLPPNHSRSTIATDAPWARASFAAASPAGPAPMIPKSNVSIAWTIPLAGAGPALAPRLVQEDRGRDGDMQAVGDAVHRDGHGHHARIGPGAAQATGFAPEDDRQRPPQGGLRGRDGRVDARRERSDAASEQPRQRLRRRRRHDGHREDRPE